MDSVFLFFALFVDHSTTTTTTTTPTAFYLMNRYNELSIIKHAKYLLISTNKIKISTVFSYKTLKRFIIWTVRFFVVVVVIVLHILYRWKKKNGTNFFFHSQAKTCLQNILPDRCIENFQWHSTQAFRWAT